MDGSHRALSQHQPPLPSQLLSATVLTDAPAHPGHQSPALVTSSVLMAHQALPQGQVCLVLHDLVSTSSSELRLWETSKVCLRCDRARGIHPSLPGTRSQPRGSPVLISHCTTGTGTSDVGSHLHPRLGMPNPSSKPRCFLDFLVAHESEAGAATACGTSPAVSRGWHTSPARSLT